ncbi:fibropellin-1-like isoform X1 [Lytechinus pictus]|uniref:fibropellin-1-like isoform X1 n=1 Tax=Lytechinus pictus TaxID=7653 RepID=UPI0030B9D524
MLLVGLSALLLLGLARVPEVTAQTAGSCPTDACSGQGTCVDDATTGTFYGRSTCYCDQAYFGNNCETFEFLQNCDFSVPNVNEPNVWINATNIAHRTSCVITVKPHGADVIRVEVFNFSVELSKDTVEVGPELPGNNPEYDEGSNDNAGYTGGLYNTSTLYIVTRTDKNIESSWIFRISSDGNDCLSVETPCENGGTCIDEWQNYTCVCPTGFTGPYCGVVVDDCESGPCQNGGTCNTITTGGYTCTCTVSYTGVHCETGVVIVDSTTPNVFSSAVREGFTSQSLTFNLAFSPASTNTYSISGGSGLWQVNGFFSSASNGATVVGGSALELTASQQATNWNPPFTTTIASIAANSVPVPSNILCSDMEYFCARLDRGPAPNPLYELLGDPDATSLRGCTSVTCRGVEIIGSSLTITSGNLRDGLSQTVTANFNLQSDAGGGAVSGTGLWTLGFFSSDSLTSTSGNGALSFTFSQPYNVGVNPGQDAVFNGLNFEVDLSGQYTCDDIPYICIIAAKNVDASPDFTLTTIPNDNVLTACTSITCTGVEIADTSVIITSGDLLEGESGQTVTFGFSMNPSSNSGAVSGTNLWSFVAVGSDGTNSLTSNYNVNLAGQGGVSVSPGSTSTFSNLNFDVDLSGNVNCDSLPSICVTIAKRTTSPLPNPDFSFSGTPTDDVLTSCDTITCRDVSIASTTTTVSAGVIGDGLNNNVPVSITITPSSNSGTAIGDGLWMITVFASASADGSGTRFDEVDIGLTDAQAGTTLFYNSQATISGLVYPLNLADGPDCSQFTHICTELQRGANPQPSYTLASGSTVSCVAVDCSAVELVELSLTAPAYVVEGENNDVDLSISLTSSADSSVASGDGLWKVTAFASSNAAGSGFRYDEQVINLSTGQAGTTLQPGVPTTISGLGYTLSTSNGPTCSQFGYICVVVEKGDNPMPEFNLEPTSITDCTAVDCRGVDISQFSVTLDTAEVFHGQADNIIMDLFATASSDYGSISGANIWGLTAWLSNSQSGSGTRYELDSNVPISSMAINSGQTTTFMNVEYFVDLTTSPTCDQFSYVCVELSRNSGDFELTGDLMACTPVTCTDIDECDSGPCLNGGTCNDMVNGYTCSCRPGYTGVFCQININECASGPCLNGGTCFDRVNSYVCQCAPGYTGIRCETDINECASSPCQNGAFCTDQVNAYFCTCLAGFTGPLCSININECASGPCQNGGTCSDQINGYQCQCLPGYTGTACQIDIDECASVPCLNAGTCIDQVNQYTCTCPSGYTGTICGININECASGPCQNSGTCVDQVNQYICFCLPGYTGTHCETNINECLSGPCRNGATCIDGINMYTCQCAPGFTGTFCGVDINECASNPCSQGSCIDRVNSFECQCFPGYTGTLCDININECASGPCENGGTCIDQVNQYICNCPAGFTGTHCEININECASGPCENGGTCIDQVNQYTCNCVPGYTGTRCQININECASAPCLNGGYCVDGINSYTCQCAAGFTSTRCEININECASSPCLNGGTCLDGVNMFTCQCTSQWTGVICQTSLNACISSPCQNGGTCSNSGTDYICECSPGFAGTNCEININECASLPCQNGGECQDGVAMYTCICPEGYSGVNCNSVGFCNLEGVWFNELNDQISISLTSTGMFLGDYKSSIEVLTGYYAPTVVVGYANQNCDFPSFGFVITRDNGKSTTSWSGQCHLCDGEEVLYTTWTNTERVTTCAAVKRATLIGTDKWTRYQQSTAPREDL